MASMPGGPVSGTCHWGATYNVIPEQVRIGGTVRAFSRAVIEQINTGVRRIANGVVKSFGAGVDVDLRWIFPPTINDAKEAEFAAGVCDTIVGIEHVDRDPQLIMASEDFAFMLEKVPGCYVNIGNGEGESSCELHNPGYDFNDRATPLGVSFFVRVVQMRLSRSA